MASPMPKSFSFLKEKRDCSERGGGGRGGICLVWRCVSELAYLSPMGWPCIYSGCSTSWMVIRSPSHWMEYFLFYSISDLFQDIGRIVYLR